MIFSKNLKRLREQAGLTRKAMAEKIGVSLSAYTNYEAGNRSPNLERLPLIAVVLHVSIDELLDFKQGEQSMRFHENLRKYRKELGMTAKDFAELIGIKYTTYTAYENQGREPKYDTLIKIADALHVSVDELLGHIPEQQ